MTQQPVRAGEYTGDGATAPSIRGMGCPLKPVEAMALLVGRLRDCAREAERAPLQLELTRIADALLAIRNGLLSAQADAPGYSGKTPGRPGHNRPARDARRSPDYARNATAREKNPEPGMRTCSRCHSLLPVDMFTVTDAETGKRRADCKVCYNEGQRTRYVRAGYKIVTVEVLDGDPCVGHPCPVCGKPFEVGQHIQGDNLHHDGCNPIAMAAETGGL